MNQFFFYFYFSLDLLLKLNFIEFCPQIPVDIALSANANACEYYNSKKKASQKEEKTAEAADRAIREAEKKTHASLQDHKVS